MKKVSKTRERSNANDRVEAYKESVQGDFEFSTHLTLIQQLIPSGLMAVEEILQEEGTHSAGEPYSRIFFHKALYLLGCVRFCEFFCFNH